MNDSYFNEQREYHEARIRHHQDQITAIERGRIRHSDEDEDGRLQRNTTAKMRAVHEKSKDWHETLLVLVGAKASSRAITGC